MRIEEVGGGVAVAAETKAAASAVSRTRGAQGHGRQRLSAKPKLRHFATRVWPLAGGGGLPCRGRSRGHVLRWSADRAGARDGGGEVELVSTYGRAAAAGGAVVARATPSWPRSAVPRPRPLSASGAPSFGTLRRPGLLTIEEGVTAHRVGAEREAPGG
jgi:hypothetical protein